MPHDGITNAQEYLRLRRLLILQLANPNVQHFRQLLSDKTKLVVTVHISNVLGSISPVAEIAECAHRVGAKVLLDCCQSVPNCPVDVQALGADWIVASGHKMCAPTGCGFLWGELCFFRAHSFACT